MTTPADPMRPFLGKLAGVVRLGDPFRLIVGDDADGPAAGAKIIIEIGGRLLEQFDPVMLIGKLLAGSTGSAGQKCTEIFLGIRFAGPPPRELKSLIAIVPDTVDGVDGTILDIAVP